MYNNSPEPIILAIRAIILHTFVVQVIKTSSPRLMYIFQPVFDIRRRYLSYGPNIGGGGVYTGSIKSKRGLFQIGALLVTISN